MYIFHPIPDINTLNQYLRDNPNELSIDATPLRVEYLRASPNMLEFGLLLHCDDGLRYVGHLFTTLNKETGKISTFYDGGGVSEHDHNYFKTMFRPYIMIQPQSRDI